jgi:hypothetical protein
MSMGLKLAAYQDKVSKEEVWIRKDEPGSQ